MHFADSVYCHVLFSDSKRRAEALHAGQEPLVRLWKTQSWEEHLACWRVQFADGPFAFGNAKLPNVPSLWLRSREWHSMALDGTKYTCWKMLEAVEAAYCCLLVLSDIEWIPEGQKCSVHASRKFKTHQWSYGQFVKVHNESKITKQNHRAS